MLYENPEHTFESLAARSMSIPFCTLSMLSPRTRPSFPACASVESFATSPRASPSCRPRAGARTFGSARPSRSYPGSAPSWSAARDAARRRSARTALASWRSRREVTARGHGARSRRAATARGHGEMSRREVTASGYSERSRRDVTARGHGERSRREDTAGGHGGRSRREVTARSHGGHGGRSRWEVTARGPGDARGHAGERSRREVADTGRCTGSGRCV